MEDVLSSVGRATAAKELTKAMLSIAWAYGESRKTTVRPERYNAKFVLATYRFLPAIGYTESFRTTKLGLSVCRNVERVKSQSRNPRSAWALPGIRDSGNKYEIGNGRLTISQETPRRTHKRRFASRTEAVCKMTLCGIFQPCFLLRFISEMV
jgi:hypothetical protein